jgi:hypothetical protein
MPAALPRLVHDSRAQLFSALSEAAELEHNFLCLHLHAASGLKRTAQGKGMAATPRDGPASQRATPAKSSRATSALWRGVEVTR